jgi:threonine dehydratase
MVDLSNLMKEILMNIKFFRKVGLLASTSSLALVVACGGGGGGGSFNAASDTIGTINSTLAAIAASPANFSSFISLLDANYKQDGISKAQLSDMLALDAAALPNEASFPSVSYSDATISNCDASGICDMTVTVTNNDADSVSTTMTLKIKESVTGYKLIGDQSSAV